MEEARTANDDVMTVERETDKQSKVKCLSKSEYNAMVQWIDTLINNNANFILNRYNGLFDRALSKYTHLNDHTVMSIVDSRVQFYVRHRHHRVFNNNTTHSSTSAKAKPNQSPNQRQQYRRPTNPTKTVYARYKDMAADVSVKSPLLTLANNLRMPAMLVAKVVLTERINEEKLKNYPNSDNSSNSSKVLNDKNDVSTDSNILDDKSNISTDSNLLNNSTVSSNDSFAINSATTEISSSLSVDEQLSQQLNWLTNRLCTLKSVQKQTFNKSANSSNNSGSSSAPVATKNSNISTHQLATFTWLMDIDPQLAYHVHECSVVDGHYGSCVEILKMCTGKRFEQILQKNMKSIATMAKSQSNGINPLFITENECRLRGLDMTPDMVLNEPIAISLSDEESNLIYDQKHIAQNYVGGGDNVIRVLNWIESKAMFGCPEKLRHIMQRQLFPYWNRYGPGAVIFWFGHILEDNEKDQNVHTGVSTNNTTTNRNSVEKAGTPTKVDSHESYNFWSKYCLLMDGFPAPNRIVMHNQKNNNRQNCLKKKKLNTRNDSL